MFTDRALVLVSRMVCAGCEVARPFDELLSFSCDRRGQDDVDHVLRTELGDEAVLAGWPQTAVNRHDNAFLRYRKLSYTWHLATARGFTDAEYIDIVEDLARKLVAVDGRAPTITPLLDSEELSTRIKNETVNVSGSHKARHLIGTALHLEIADRLGANTSETTLAIASCGNAALAAAVVAKAAGRRLRVFIPPNASPAVVKQLASLGAERVICERQDSDPPGDPCYLRFVEAVAAGALPFSCQGGDNALALIGGQTLGWELVEQCQSNPPSDVFVQVGGGALASSVMQAFQMAKSSAIIDRLPRFHAVQTENAHPLVRAWQRMGELGKTWSEARSHRSEFMWPWESEPKSIAGGILDDETYDWLSIVTGLQASGGDATTVTEAQLEAAHKLAIETTGIQVCATGTAGFAGLQAARARKALSGEARPVVLFTGAIR